MCALRDRIEIVTAFALGRALRKARYVLVLAFFRHRKLASSAEGSTSNDSADGSQRSAPARKENASSNDCARSLTDPIAQRIRSMRYRVTTTAAFFFMSVCPFQRSQSGHHSSSGRREFQPLLWSRCRAKTRESFDSLGSARCNVRPSLRLRQ